MYTSGWYPARNAVHVEAVAVQQLQRFDVPAAAGNVSGHPIGWIGPGFEQQLREREVSHRADGAPQRRSWQLRMPVPVILGIRIGSSSQSRAAIATSPSTRDGSSKCMHVWHT
jgi:hypothetical protein